VLITTTQKYPFNKRWSIDSANIALKKDWLVNQLPKNKKLLCHEQTTDLEKKGLVHRATPIENWLRPIEELRDAAPGALSLTSIALVLRSCQCVAEKEGAQRTDKPSRRSAKRSD